MKSRFILPVMVMAAAIVSCSGNKNASETSETPVEQTVATPQLDGTWRLADYAGEGEMAVMDSTDSYLLKFNPAEGTFGMNTDCNSLGGQYAIANDSLTFTNIAATQMLCPDDRVERAMKTILPMITGYTINADSVLALRSDGRIMARFTPAE